jgi:uncharacterized protein YbjT (DUF2867 family)
MGGQSVGVTGSREAEASSTSATESRIIAVAGATGAQGGGLVRAIVRDPDSGFVARAITRNPSSERAQALGDLGVEVVQADLDDRDSLVEALQGAHGAFCVTNYWELYDPQKEKAQARNLALAAQAADVQHVIWSTLEDTRKFVPLSSDRMPTLLGHYKVPHFDGKGEADQFFTDAGVPTTFLLASFYWENMIYFGLGPKVGPDGVLTLSLPIKDAPLAGICADDIGACAYGVFRSGADVVGKRIGIAGEHLTGDEMASRLANALGREVRYAPVSPDVFRSFGFPGAEDIGNMFQFYTEYSAECLATRSVSATRALYPEVLNFERWLEKKGQLIPLD